MNKLLINYEKIQGTPPTARTGDEDVEAAVTITHFILINAAEFKVESETLLQQFYRRSVRILSGCSEQTDEKGVWTKWSISPNLMMIFYGLWFLKIFPAGYF